MLGTLRLDAHAHLCRAVGHLDSGGGLVAVLPAGAGPRGRDDVEVVVPNDELRRTRLGEYGDGDGARLNTPAPFGRRHALPTMPARFVHEHSLGVWSGHA